MLLAALPLEGLRGFGDLVHFYRLAGMGRPYLDYWVEFPPVFPLLSAALYHLAGGREHVYDYLLVILLSMAQAGSLAFFMRIGRGFLPETKMMERAWVYFALMVALPYGWWYFDPLAVFAMLLGLAWLLEGRPVRTGLALAAGALIKLFPALVLALAWRRLPLRRAVTVTALALGVTALVYGALFLASPQLTAASLRSQASKGSWETAWALLDGNFNTGNFGPESERFDPQAAFLGLAWTVFLLWSPGWSPQWVLYLLPLVLLALPEREGGLLALALVFINLLEWPVMLSRGLVWGLWLTIPLRTLLFVIMVVEFWKTVPHSKSAALLPSLESK
jgi:hypothetical protein